MPRAFNAATSSRTGRTIPVGLVTWLTSTSRVRGVTASRIAASASSGPAIGKGIRATTTVAPSRAATKRIALSVALYSWSLVSSSSPGSKRSDCSTVLTPVVAFVTKARPSGSAPRKAPIASRASSSRPGRSPDRNRTGSASSRSRQRPLDREDRLRARAVRAVVEERHGRIQPPAEVRPHRRAHRGVVNVPPGGVTTVGPPRARLPADVTLADDVPDDRVGARVIRDRGRALRDAEEPEAGRCARPEPLGDGGPGRGIRVRADRDARDDVETWRAAGRRPGPWGHRHRARAGAAQDGAALVRPDDGGPGQRSLGAPTGCDPGRHPGNRPGRRRPGGPRCPCPPPTPRPRSWPVSQ